MTDDPITETEYTDTGLQNGTLYWYVVRSVDVAGNRSTNDDPEIQVPVDLTPPSVPTGVEVGVDDGAWSSRGIAVDDADLWGYQLYRVLVRRRALDPQVGEGTRDRDNRGRPGQRHDVLVRRQRIDTANNESERSEPASGVPADIEAPFAPHPAHRGGPRPGCGAGLGRRRGA